jgi:hypothetical protein
VSVQHSWQVPLQSCVPGGQAQAPFWQTSPPVQTLPQLPQLLASPCVFAQRSPQQASYCASGQHSWPHSAGMSSSGSQPHRKSVQIAAPGQRAPQEPQLFLSERMLVHTPPQH